MRTNLINLCSLFSLIAKLCVSLKSGAYGIHLPDDKSELKNIYSPVNHANSIVAGYMLADATDMRLNLSDPIDRNLSAILDRDGPDMRPSRDYKDFQDITLEVSKRAWKLLHEHATIAVRDRVELAQPAINQVLVSANVSLECRDSVGQVLEGAKRMESWAIKLLNSWGNFPPIGLFEGTYSDIGSYHTCVNIPENEYIEHSHYCTITYRPVMASRGDYELVIRREPDSLLNLFDKQTGEEESTKVKRTSAYIPQPTPKQISSKLAKDKVIDAFKDILVHSQYHHFVYYKWGTCWPIKCSPFDIRRVSKLLGRKNILMNGPVKCFSKFSNDYDQADSVENYSNTDNTTTITTSGSNSTNKKLVISLWDKNHGIFIWKPFFSRTQKVALSIIVTLFLFIGFMTLIDLFINRVPFVYKQFRLAMRNHPLSIAESKHTHNLTINSNSKVVENNENGTSLHEFNNGCPEDLTCNYALIDQPPQLQNNILVLKNTIGNDPSVACPQVNSNEGKREGGNHRELSTFMSFVNDCSIITNTTQFFTVTQSQLRSEILCLNGLRCITMIWIIMTHTMMYNDWSAFARTREIEKSVKSLISQPLFNGSYLVDTFFLMSGLLSSYTAFRHCQGVATKFNSIAYIFGRWLRLTPQIFFISMVFIVLPAVSDGPHWFPIVGEYSENCVENWWVNVLHLQAFYEKEKMCNFVTWWISIDFFYHFVALAIIWIVLLTGHQYGFLSIAAFVSGQIAWQAFKHYELSLPPNILSTIPQTGAMWTEMTLSFFWTPYSHAVPFFFGLYLGYLMALKQKLILKHLNSRRAVLGWALASSLLTFQSYGTFWWVTGQASYSRLLSTVYYIMCTLIWSSSFCWIIIACHHGYGGFINKVLSWRVFIVLGKASYLVYLSHFQVMFIFYGNQGLLLEPTPLTMFYVILGNIFIATLYGVFLCIVLELPWLKAQRRLVKYL